MTMEGPPEGPPYCLKDLQIRSNAKIVCHKQIAMTRVAGDIRLQQLLACFETTV